MRAHSDGMSDQRYVCVALAVGESACAGMQPILTGANVADAP